MDPDLPAPPLPPRTVRYAFTRSDEPLAEGETVVEDGRVVAFMREELPRRAAELRAKLADLERGAHEPRGPPGLARRPDRACLAA